MAWLEWGSPRSGCSHQIQFSPWPAAPGAGRLARAAIFAMVCSTTPQPRPAEALLNFLRHRMGLSEGALALGLKQAELDQAPLPAVLWRYGLLSLEQLAQVFDWQEDQP